MRQLGWNNPNLRGSSSNHKPLRVNSAGTVCVGWSSVGKRKGFSHCSEVPHSVWLRERQFRAEADLEDMFFQECTVLYPAQTKLATPLACSHQVLTIKTARAPFSQNSGLVSWTFEEEFDLGDILYWTYLQCICTRSYICMSDASHIRSCPCCEQPYWDSFPMGCWLAWGYGGY